MARRRPRFAGRPPATSTYLHFFHGFGSTSHPQGEHTLLVIAKTRTKQDKGGRRTGGW